MMTAETQRVARIFNGTYTIESTKTGEHRTFEIRTQKPDAKFAPGKRTIALLNGPNNEYDYQGFAFVDDRGTYTWRKHCGTQFEVFARMIWDLAIFGKVSGWYKKGYRLHIAGRCLVCNRLLTTPDSLRAGIGPVCREQI